MGAIEIEWGRGDPLVPIEELEQGQVLVWGEGEHLCVRGPRLHGDEGIQITQIESGSHGSLTLGYLVRPLDARLVIGSGGPGEQPSRAYFEGQVAFLRRERQRLYFLLVEIDGQATSIMADVDFRATAAAIAKRRDEVVGVSDE